MPNGPDRYMIVSSDCHAGADIQGYKPYLEKRWHDEFDEWAASYRDAWLDIDPGPAALTGNAGATDLRLGVAAGALPSNWDNALRNRDLEADGIAGEVIFPNTSPPFFPSGAVTAGTPRTRADYDRRWAGLRAHNRWLADFCAELPGRRAGIAQVLLNDVDDAVAEIEWVRNAGIFGGVMIPIIEYDAPIPPLFTDAYDRIWAACVDNEVIAHEHASVTGIYDDYVLTDVGRAMVMLETHPNVSRPLWHMIFGGTFDRFPELEFVMTEVGSRWVPERLASLDFLTAATRHPSSSAERYVAPSVRAFLAPSVSKLSLTPSEYFARNIWIGASFMGRGDVEAGVLDKIGDRLMWGSDYPHSEGTFPSTEDFVSATFFDRTVEETQRILADTAIDLYGFDRAAVRAAADRIGPRVERVALGASR